MGFVILGSICALWGAGLFVFSFSKAADGSYHSESAQALSAMWLGVAALMWLVAK